MDIKLGCLTEELDLAEYHAGINVKLRVWVNTPPKFYARFLSIVKDYNTDKQDELAEWLSELLSKDADKTTHVSVAEINALINDTKDTDPRFLAWLLERATALIADYRKKK